MMMTSRGRPILYIITCLCIALPLYCLCLAFALPCCNLLTKSTKSRINILIFCHVLCSPVLSVVSQIVTHFLV